MVTSPPVLTPPRDVPAAGKTYAFAPDSIPASFSFSAVVKSLVERPLPSTLSTLPAKAFAIIR